MLILVRKAFQDLWHTKLRTFAIIFTIVLSICLGVGFVNATRDISRLKKLPGGQNTIGRLMLPTQVDVDGERFETYWISLPYYPNKPYSEINKHHIIKGCFISSSGTAEALVGNLFTKEHAVELGGAITVCCANRSMVVTVVGVVGSLKYLYVVWEAGYREVLAYPIRNHGPQKGHHPRRGHRRYRRRGAVHGHLRDGASRYIGTDVQKGDDPLRAAIRHSVSVIGHTHPPGIK